MERTVPSTGSDEIELYLQTYYSLLRSTAEVSIRTLEESHSRMKSLLHSGARQTEPDMSAFIYSLLRIPDAIFVAESVVMGQRAEDFIQTGIGDVESWELVSSVARRRRWFFDGESTLACYVASRSDIDDIIPLLTAFQLEWNKMHILLGHVTHFQKEKPFEDLAGTLQMDVEDLQRLSQIWGEDFYQRLKQIAGRERRLRVRLLSGSFSQYQKSTMNWVSNITCRHPAITDSPIYFVSSNPHSIKNMLTGFALSHKRRLTDFAESGVDPLLTYEWEQIKQGKVVSSEENFLYYALKKYQAQPDGAGSKKSQRSLESGHGIHRVFSPRAFDVEAQVIHLDQLDPAMFDRRIIPPGMDMSYLAKSNALIVNIDYPLGLAAYNILSKVAEHAGKILGVYVLGKAATLNGVIGDVMIPIAVHDEQSLNTFLFSNCFSAEDVSPYLMHGSVLDNQKAVTVLGTFLQNQDYMHVFYQDGYTDIEMEAGPYLSAIYEIARPKRYPVNEVVNLSNIDFDIGFIHYASDTPLSKGKNLGAGSLSYYGLDSTYASTIAILQRIFQIESKRINKTD